MNKEYIDLKRRIVYRGEVYQAIEDERIKTLPAVLNNRYMDGVHDGLKNALRALAKVNDISTADVAPVKHGRWIDDKVSFYLGCSECGCFLEYAVDTFIDNGDHYNYCPNCGARMDGGADDGRD